MRTVTLTGTMRLFTLLQTGSSDWLAMTVKQGLENNGWGVQSVSISRNSIFNNTLNVTIVINALGNDVSQRIDDGVTNFLSNFLVENSLIFRDVYLNIAKDTGAEVAIVSKNSTPKRPTRTVIRTAPKTVDRGLLATVTIDANSPENQIPDDDKDFIDGIAQSFNVSRNTVIAGSVFLAILISRRM